MRETIRHSPLVLLALLTTLMILSGCKSEPSAESPSSIPPGGSTPKETNSGDDAIAVIGGTPITRQQLLDRLLSEYGAQTLRSMMLALAVEQEANALQLKVTDEELEQELRVMRQGYDSEEQFYAAMSEQLGMNREEVREDAKYRLLLEKLSVRNVEVTEAEIDRYMEENRAQFEPRHQYQLAIIVVDDGETADSVLSQLAGGADFGAMARQYSLDEFTADEGGELGWVEDQDPFLEPELLEAAGAMEVGDMTGPIATDRGYVILQLSGRSVVEPKAPEDAREEVRRLLALGKAPSMQNFEQSLLEKYGATVKDPALGQ